MCGEKNVLEGTPIPAKGSPPHVRGKVEPTDWGSRLARITPACAGKRHSLLICRITVGDHPRMCGEKERNYQKSTKRIGSPPHVRGKVAGLFQVPDTGGITPACAGKSTNL